MKKVFSIISTLLLVMLVVLAAAIVVPLVAGFKEMAVLSGSMVPEIPVGSIIYVKQGIEPASLNTGDIVTYALDSETYVTHRVVSVDTANQTLITKGDANDTEDPEIQFSQVFGKAVFHLPFLGYISMSIHKPIGIMAITVLIIVVILLNFIPAIVGQKNEKKAEK